MSDNKRRRLNNSSTILTPEQEVDLNEVEETFNPFINNLQSEIDNPNVSFQFDDELFEPSMPELTINDLNVSINPEDGITDTEMSTDVEEGNESQETIEGGRKTRKRNRKGKKRKSHKKNKTRRKSRKVRKTMKKNKKFNKKNRYSKKK